ncbi:MAG: DUF3078 domain-containing protein [Bacteroidaceae bacterium]|nr:DUF3078 domain-containing protein [Bacteroidaceae bacterium]
MRLVKLAILWLLALTMQAQHKSVVDRYVDSLRLAMSQKSYELSNDYDVSPYYYQMFFPSTYYSNVTRSVLSLDSAAQTPMNLQLLRIYASRPSLVNHYDEQFKNEALLEASRSASDKSNADLKKEINSAISSSSKNRVDKDDFDIGLQVVKPNFWKTAGNFSLKFTQNYFSENWYQGGNNNQTMLATLNLSAIYNDTKKITWENRLDVRLGFITTPSDTCHTFLTNNDKLQLNTKLGVKAAKNWNYTVSGEAKTQMMGGYRTNNRLKFSDFLSPLDVSLSIGMDFKPKLKNNNTLSVALLPLSYKMRYIRSHNENIHKVNSFVNRTLKQDYGSRLEVNCKFTIVKNLTWKCRSYAFTSYKYVEAEMENIFTFEFSKYISTDLYTLWRFDDNRPMKFYDDNLGYFQFKEYITLGLKYDF